MVHPLTAERFAVGDRVYHNATHRYARIEIMPTIAGVSTGRACVVGSGKVWGVTLADCRPA
jgi:hypothetical protein